MIAVYMVNVKLALVYRFETAALTVLFLVLPVAVNTYPFSFVWRGCALARTANLPPIKTRPLPAKRTGAGLPGIAPGHCGLGRAEDANAETTISVDDAVDAVPTVSVDARADVRTAPVADSDARRFVGRERHFAVERALQLGRH